MWVMFSIFWTVFLAELGDKTQLATMMLASNKSYNAFTVFLLSSAALIASCGIAALLGAFATKYLDMVPLELIAGVGFVVLGVISIVGYFR